MIQCAECGHENMDGLEYCDACGAKLPAATPLPAPEVRVAAAAPAESQAAVSAQPTSAPSDVSVAPQPRGKLTIIRGGTIGKEFLLQSGDNLVGRWDPDSGAFPEVDLEMDDPEARISRKHALIRVGDQISIEDIGSLNGTFVNRGRRLEPGSPVTLHDGDEIIIGKTFLRFTLS
ncbi:MAG TPA: FHA domain-containing protein [Methylomirabilota bacterium]|nr:FHA domain-containing protein [Methylomirabilota bacterium]